MTLEVLLGLHATSQLSLARTQLSPQRRCVENTCNVMVIHPVDQVIALGWVIVLVLFKAS